MTSDVVGIDLGTTNSVVAWTDDQGSTEVLTGPDGARIVPSVVYFPENDGEVIVGDRGLQYAVLDPHRFARLFKRGMGERTFLPDGSEFVVDGKTWSPEELSMLVVKKLQAAADHARGAEVRRAVITVPAYFGEPERAATRLAGELAGFEVLRILNEPTAAAIAHGLDRVGESTKLLVFDLGGGTFDVTVMSTSADGSMEVLSTGGDRRLGGADFDALILERMSEFVDAQTGSDLADDPYSFFEARQKAEDIKKDLSTMETAQRPLTVSGRPVMFSVTRTEFEGMIADHVQDVRDTVETTLEESGLSPSDITTILMVGGSSRIPVFKRILQEVTGTEPIFSKNLDEDVARGASILAAKLRGDATPNSTVDMLPVPVDVASHGLGVTMLDDERVPQNQVLIAAGSQIPASADYVAGAAFDNQIDLELELNEGDDSDLEYVRNLGRSQGRLSRAVPQGYPIRIEMSYDADQLIVVKAFDGETGAFICDLKVRHEGLLDEESRTQAKALLSRLEVN